MDTNNRLVERWDGWDYERHPSHQRAWGSGRIALPTELRKPFRDGVVDAMLARTRQPDGTYLEPFRRITTWVRKAA